MPLTEEEKKRHNIAGRKALIDYATGAGLTEVPRAEWGKKGIFEGERSYGDALADSRYYPEESPVSMEDRIYAAQDFTEEQEKTASPLYLATMPHTATSEFRRRQRGYATPIPMMTALQEHFTKKLKTPKGRKQRVGGWYDPNLDKVEMNIQNWEWPGVESVRKDDPGEFKEKEWKSTFSDTELHELIHGIHKDYNARKINAVPHSRYKMPAAANKLTPLAPKDITMWQGEPLRDFVKGETNAGITTFEGRRNYLNYVSTNKEMLPRIAWEMRNRLLQQGDKAKAKLDPAQIRRWLEDPMHPDLRYWLIHDPAGYKKWLESGWPVDVMQRSVEYKSQPSTAPGLSYPPSEMMA